TKHAELEGPFIRSSKRVNDLSSTEVKSQFETVLPPDLRKAVSVLKCSIHPGLRPVGAEAPESRSASCSEPRHANERCGLSRGVLWMNTREPWRTRCDDGLRRHRQEAQPIVADTKFVDRRGVKRMDLGDRQLTVEG